MTYNYDFERLDVYRLSVQVARYMRGARWPTGTAHLRDQGTRAADPTPEIPANFGGMETCV